MFGKDKNHPDEGVEPAREELIRGQGQERRSRAWIGESVVVGGDLTSSEEMTIAGRVEGDVAVPEHTLIVAPGATIRGDVSARTVEVHGQVLGSITATENVEVGKTGSVRGDIDTSRMKIVEGAALGGRLEVGGPSASQNP